MRDEPRIRPFRRRPTRGIALVVVLAGACMPLAADSVVVSPSCDQVPKVENAFLKFTSQDSAVVDCHRGFVLHGSDDMTCTHGTWSAAPECIIRRRLDLHRHLRTAELRSSPSAPQP
jgi:hypothetical protein